MVNAGLISGAEIEEIKDKVNSEVEGAIEFARKSAVPDPELALKHVYAKFP